jgi:hypothetical protein
MSAFDPKQASEHVARRGPITVTVSDGKGCGILNAMGLPTGS